MLKSTLVRSTVLALVVTALSGCGKDNAAGETPALTAAATRNGSSDPYAGNDDVKRPDDARPVKNTGTFTDAEAAKQFVDERDKLDPKDAPFRDELIGLLSFWDDSTPKAVKTSNHVRKQAEKILKRGAPFADSEQANLMNVVATKDPNAALHALNVVLEQKTSLSNDTRAKLIGYLAYWNADSKTYAKESTKVRKLVKKGISHLLPLSEAEHGLVMDQVEKKDPYVAVMGLELLKKQKKDLSSATRARISALAAYDNSENNAYASESKKVRSLVASILK